MNFETLFRTEDSGWTNISKVLGVGQANIAKINGVLKANIAKK